MWLVVLASCDQPPVEATDDPLLAGALRQAGCLVSIRPWTAIDPASLPPGSVVVLRSTWDYHRQAERFLDWLAVLERARIPVLNSPRLVRLTIDKSYLVRNRPFGCAAQATMCLRSDADIILREIRARNWTRFIVKPPVSASADGTFLVDTNNSAALEDALQRLPAHVLVQEFLPEIQEGEFSLIFFGGSFSHAVRKIPAPGDFRVQEEFGSRTESIQPPPPALAAGDCILRSLPEMPCYARVDGIMRDAQFLLMEVELIEPELFLRYRPGAAEGLAEAIVNRLSPPP